MSSAVYQIVQMSSFGLGRPFTYSINNFLTFRWSHGAPWNECNELDSLRKGLYNFYMGEKLIYFTPAACSAALPVKKPRERAELEIPAPERAAKIFTHNIIWPAERTFWWAGGVQMCCFAEAPGCAAECACSPKLTIWIAIAIILLWCVRVRRPPTKAAPPPPLAPERASPNLANFWTCAVLRAAIDFLASHLSPNQSLRSRPTTMQMQRKTNTRVLSKHIIWCAERRFQFQAYLFSAAAAVKA